MLSHMNQASRAIILRARGRIRGPAQIEGQRFAASTSPRDEHATSKTGLPADPLEGERPKPTRTPLDHRVHMSLLRKSISKPGLRVYRNRDSLVNHFYAFSKSVLDGELDVEELQVSKTFLDLQQQIEFNIDYMSNAQLVNLLASVIKMRIDPSTNMVRLLEHEIKFRMSSLSLNQANKLIKFYSRTTLKPDQRQLMDMLSYRIRSAIQSDDLGLKELVDVLDLIATQQLDSSYLPVTEERILFILTANRTEKELDDDMISRFINKRELFDYETLCQLFVKLSNNRRRPPPILRAASHELCRVPTPKHTGDTSLVNSMIGALSSLANLNYPNRSLNAKLSGDLTKLIKIADLDSNTLCNLLRSLRGLRWRDPKLLDMFYDHFSESQDDLKRIDHNCVITLLHVTAILNFKPCKDLNVFYRNLMKDNRENYMDKTSRKWLGYVWSLAALKLCDEDHLKSVLCKEYVGVNAERITYADKIKLLNLTAIAKYEFDFEDHPLDGLKDHLKSTTARGIDMQRFSAKIGEALKSLVGNTNWIRNDSPTPCGFTVDCEIMLNENLEPIEWNDPPLAKLLEDSKCKEARKSSQGRKRCALLYVPFDETISNNMSEPLGYKLMVARILEYVGCETIFLPETVINREKTSADLTKRINTILKNPQQDIAVDSSEK